MKWTPGYKGRNVEDRRGQPSKFPGGMKAGVGLGGIVALLIAVLGQKFMGGSGGDTGAAIGKAIEVITGQKNAGATDPSQPYVASSPEEETYAARAVEAFDRAQALWSSQIKATGAEYPPATIVPYTQGTSTGCGFGDAAMGPFYCPADHRVYIDLSFYIELDKRFGAPGDFAQAYVIAHEVGHHIQNVLGADAKMRAMSEKDPSKANHYSVMLELQADCYAGIWAHHDQKQMEIDASDIKEGLRAAAAIGDDTLQKGAGRRVNPESWTHGSSEQRVHWFEQGFKSGQVASCDTFALGI